MPDPKRKEHDDDVDSEEEEELIEEEEEEVVPEFTEDVSHLTPTSIEVIANQVRCQTLCFVTDLTLLGLAGYNKSW